MTTTPPRGPGSRARYLVARSRQLLTDGDARDAVRARSHLRALRRINADLRVVGVADDGGTTFVLASDDVITPILLARGHFQRNDFHRARELAGRHVPRPGASTFVDVGANVGTTTLYAARTGAYGRIVAVEPSPDNLAVIRLNVQANELEDLVEVVASACGAEAGQVELMLSSVSAGDHRVRRAGEVPSTHQAMVQVPERTLDEILASTGVAPADVALVWVDTQGHEPAVLAGAHGTVAGGAPFLVEFWPEMYVADGTLDEHLQGIGELFSGYIDLREPGERTHPPSDLRGLAERLVAERHGQTDLLLLPRS